MGVIGREFRGRPLYWLLVALPAAFVMDGAGASELWVFGLACTSIVPLASLMGRATENLANSLGAGMSGLLNATFGNAAELIIALVALSKGPHMYELVQASITGSIIGNVLLVFGLSVTLGGLRYERQSFNRTAAASGATLLTLAAIGLTIPAIYHSVLAPPANGAPQDQASFHRLSEEIAGILLAVYVLSLLFSLRTHRHLYDVDEATAHGALASHPPEWSRAASIGVLLAATVGVAIMSEKLVGAVDHARESLGMNGYFVGVIVVAIVGNAAEHSTAVMVALKNKMDLSVNIAVGSSIQVALFVAPVLVFANLAFNGEPLDLHFHPLETISLLIAIAVLAMVSQDGETHWLEGVMLLAVYAMLGLAFYHLPATS